jgi:hypothetical protein
MAFDRYRLARGRKPEAPGNAVLQQFHVGVFELDDLVAVNANQMVVRRMFDKIRLVP